MKISCQESFFLGMLVNSYEILYTTFLSKVACVWLCLCCPGCGHHCRIRIMMMMNRFCGMVDRRKAFSLFSSRDHCQRSSPSRISNTKWAGFEPAQNLSSDLVEWTCAVVITTAQHPVMVYSIRLPLYCWWFTVTC